jgi:dihydrofolate reductase
VIVSLIVAMDRERGIGLVGAVPLHLSEDLKNFKRLTMGHHLIVGRVTYESIGRPLPGRKMVVVTRNPAYQADGCDVVSSLEAALELARRRGESEAFVGGGAQIFAAALPMAERIYLTEVDAQAQADTWFPDFDRSAWEEKESRRFPADADNDHPFTIRVLDRIA